MTPERIDMIVKRLMAIAATAYSNYAGFHLEKQPMSIYYDRFIVNDQEFHSYNLTVELENSNDVTKILTKFFGKNKEEVLDELEYSGDDSRRKPVYLHDLKLINDSKD